MTTGRINQVTIVRRGWPTGATGARRRDASYWRAPVRARRAAALLAGGRVRRWRQSAFPLFVPQGIRPPHRTRCGPCGLGAPGGGLSASHLPFRCQRRVVAPCRSAVVLAIGQSPAGPIRRRLEAVPPSAAGQPQYAVKPERPVSWRSTTTVVQSRAKPWACKPVQEGTSGHLRDMVRVWWIWCLPPRCAAPVLAVTASEGGGLSARTAPSS